MNAMQRFVFANALIVLLVVCLCPLVDAEEFVEGKTHPDRKPTLRSLVRSYVQEFSGSLLTKRLSQIVSHPEANIHLIEEALREVLHYGTAPVGVQSQRSVTVKGQEVSFALYVPPAYSPDNTYPLILCLHGAGFTGESYLERWVPRLEDRYILVCPTIPNGAWWTRFAENSILEILGRISEEYHINRDRVFLTGMSNGGIGAWIIGMHHADLFAGIAPMASGLDDVMFPFVENLVNTPIYVIHGEKDQVMPIRLSRDLVQEMKRHGVPHQYRKHQWTHPHAGGHFFPRQELPALIAWFDQRRRISLPTKISMVRDATHLMAFSWGRIDSTDQIAAFSENLVDKRDRFIAGAIYAKLQAEITASNTIIVNTVRVKRYTLFLNERLVDFSQPIVVRTNGIQSFEGMVKPRMEILLEEARQRSDFHDLYSAKLMIDVPTSSSFEREE